MADSSADYPTTIGSDAVIKGQLQFEKGVRLLGNFEGQVESKGQLLIAEGAKLVGEVHAGSIRVEGQVKGNLTAENKVQLAASGRMEGDIEASRLEVAEGAVLVGHCMVGVDGNGRSGKRPAPNVAVTPSDSSTARPKVQPAPAVAK